MTEAELGCRLRQGDPQVLAEMIDLYGAAVYRLAARILAGRGDARDVEECCSDTFLEVLRKREQFDPGRSGLRTWVLMLTRYRALDCRRRLERYDNPAGETIPVGDDLKAAGPAWAAFTTTPETVLLEREERQRIMTALAALPPAEREILYRHYYLDESIKAIAAAAGISRGAADNRLWRARRRLKRLLLDDYGNKVVSLNGKG